MPITDNVGRRLPYSIGIDTVSVCKIIYVYVYGEWSHVAVKAAPPPPPPPPRDSRKQQQQIIKTIKALMIFENLPVDSRHKGPGMRKNMSMSCRPYMQMFLVWFSSSLWVDMQKPWKQISMEMFMYFSCVSFCTKLSTSANGVYDWPRSFVVEERCLLSEP